MEPLIVDGDGGCSDDEVQRPLGFDEQVVEPHFHTALGLDGPLQLDRLALLRVNGEDLVVFAVVKFDRLDVVKDREQMRLRAGRAKKETGFCKKGSLARICKNKLEREDNYDSNTS